MTEMNEIKDTLNLEQSDIKQLPTMLNVLTILTYVGSGIAFLSGLYSFFTVCKSVDMMDGMDELDGMGGALGNMMESAIEMAHKQCDNRVLILIVTLLAAGLCLYGAMQMRNRKKQGFGIYVIGEMLLPVVTFILLGMGSMSGILLTLSIFVPVVMIVLYATQLKHLNQ